MSLPHHLRSRFEHDDDLDDADTASQRSISLESIGSNENGFNSIPLSPTLDPATAPKRESHPDTDLSSEPGDDISLYTNEMDARESPNTSAAPSVYDQDDSNRRLSSARHSLIKPSHLSVHGGATPSSAAHNAIISPSIYGDSEPSPQPPIVLSASSVMNPPWAASSPSGPSSPAHVPSPILPNVSPIHNYPTSAGPDEIPSAFIPRELPSIYDATAATYPPNPSTHSISERESIKSFASGSSYSRKARPESLLLDAPDGPIILGLALVDFNHLVGPKIEYSIGDIVDDEEVNKILPFLALPDGAHLSTEDYSYFHVVPSSLNSTTVFGISCNRQIASASLLVKGEDVTRSTVQKAVVVLASKPVFGPIRDKLGVVTCALFNQRDFTETSILGDFAISLEASLRTQLTESGLYMGTSLRELVHTFRQRTLILVKALMLQKRIMFYGHPVERLCTFQYSLISLLPGLLQTLDDCGSPPLATRAPTLTRPTSLRTSDRKSMLAYVGLPLDIFGKDAFFQPYLPLQQLEMLKETKCWLCGSTNSIVTQQKEIDLLVNIETCTFEFRDPKLERSAGLTAADRKWMDDIVRDVNDSWNENDPSRPINMHFKGSDDYLRTKFEEYVFAALASVRYRDFVAKGEGNGVIITGGSGGDATSAEDFNPMWIQEFKRTNAYDVWDRTTDTLLFDIVEPRHPCNEKPSVVADIGLRLQEGIQDLKLDQQLAPTREAISRSFNVGSTNFLKAVEGVGRWARDASTNSASLNELLNGGRTSISRPSTPPVEITKKDAEVKAQPRNLSVKPAPFQLRQLSLPSSPRLTPESLKAEGSVMSATSSVWGGIGSFWSARATKLALPRIGKDSAAVKAAPVSPLDEESSVTDSPVEYPSDRSSFPSLASTDGL